jgi:hypothetical protein
MLVDGRNHVGYAFLSFYKILETVFPKDAKRIGWISASIADLTGFGVKEALDGAVLSGTRSPKPREVPVGTGMTLSRTQARLLLSPASGPSNGRTDRSAIELTKRRAFFAGARWRRAGREPS